MPNPVNKNPDPAYYLVSGLGPSPGGVGRLMRKLIPEAEARGFQVYFPKPSPPLRALIRKNFLAFLVGLLERYIHRLRFFIQTRRIKGATVLFLHPQTAGWHTLLSLSKSNTVYLYVMDNSFFCMRSYNLHPQTHAECLKCIPSPERADRICSNPAGALTRRKSIAQLKALRARSKDIIFLAQNHNQARLLRSALGPVALQLVGLDTGEAVALPGPPTEGGRDSRHCIVYHGATNLAKGISFFIGLAERVPSVQFIVPDALAEVEATVGRSISAPNISFQPCQWESGLAELVSTATLVVNPSLWSAPIEGALIKSFAFNSRVATVATQYGYESEIFELTGHLRLDPNIEVAASQLQDFLAALVTRPQRSKRITPYQLYQPEGSLHVLDAVMSGDVGRFSP